jgi:YbbR domain-containing protein
MIRFLTENLGWKVLSLFLSCGLWAAYMTEAEIATSIAVPLQYRNLPRDLDISTDVADRIYLKVRGPATRLTTASLAQSAIVLDLSAVTRPGEQTFSINAANVSLPAGVELVRVVPSQIRLTFERRGTREVPVEIRFAGPPPPGYRVAQQQAVPDHLVIIGPQSSIDGIRTAQTDPIDLGSTFGEAEFRVPVFLSDPHARPEREDPVVVRVRVEKIAGQ